MTDKNSHTNSDLLGKDSLPEIEVSYTKSKGEVWAELSGMINIDAEETVIAASSNETPKLIKMSWMRIAAAAVVALLISFTSFSYFHTNTIISGGGEHLAAQLPDGSTIELNAQSTITYKPLWWRFNRNVKLQGEAFFKVMKGKSFTVESSLGKTIVLGTSFNIFARNTNYKVTCYTGKVRVVSTKNGHSTDITPNELAEINKDGTIALRQLNNADDNISWINDMFVFTSTPINIVFQEIERQYNIEIVSTNELNYLYSGNFTRNRTVKEVLNMVCRPLGLKFKATQYGFVVSKADVSD